MKEKANKNLISRPPVVVIMGHVDHGKSSILEAIKDLRITAKESGGITQHIGAYEIEEKGKMITFIDTPGHEAFSAMRMRGAKVADIAILVVAAEEGLKPQTKEAIEHIKKAGIPMIVAINKIDKSTAEPEKVKRELISQDVVVEDMGGTIPSVEVSAKTKKGIDHLLEIILLISEMEDLKADISLPAEGVVIESRMDSFKGSVATVILEKGMIKKGDLIGTNSVFGKIKGLENFLGKAIDEASPSVPVRILGFENVPAVGETVKAYNTKDEWKKE
ncbi:MAG: GTP-binding protein, partial [Candidatus Nealsonbacteria bacterium]|nr:GTP-binding protein [Candidatus Nealsonbacteria bacterium]